MRSSGWSSDVCSSDLNTKTYHPPADSEAYCFTSSHASSGVRDPLDTHTEDRRFSGYQSDGGRRRRLIHQPRGIVISIAGACVRKNPGDVTMALAPVRDRKRVW